MSAIGFGAHYGVSGYTIENAIWLDGGADYLSATPLSPSSARIGSLSFWTKPAVDSSSGSDEQVIMQQDWTASGNEAIQVSLQNDYLIFRLETNAGAYLINRATSALYRDPSAWYHFHITWNTNTTSASCVTITVNGVAVTAFSASSNPGSAADSGFPNTGKTLTIGKHSVTAAYEYHNGYLAEFIFQDNVTSAATDFGEYDSNNVWIPKNPTGTVFGEAGFWLNFANTGTGTDSDGIGADVSGNNKHFAVTSMAAANVVTDTPTDKAADGIGNYCTWNAVAPENQAALTYSNANLTVNCVNSSGAMGTICTTGAGKWYFEITMTVDNTFGTVGFIGAALNIQTGGLDGNEAAEWCWQDSSGVTRNNSSAGPTLSTFTANDVLGWAVDFDNDLIWCHKNGTWQNSATLGEVVAGTSTNAVWSGTLAAATGGITPSAGCNGGTNSTFTLNCGQSTFNTTIPTGFKTIYTANLPAPAIPDPRKHFGIITHTGSGTTKTVTSATAGVTSSVDFTPDFGWSKPRAGTENHQIIDIVGGEDNYLVPDDTYAYNTGSNITFVDGGYQVASGNNDRWNKSTVGIVTWMWKAGGTPTATNNNTSGAMDANSVILNGVLQSSYTPSGSPTIYPNKLSANTTAGFSIVTYTGNGNSSQSFPHGLTKAPEMVIIKYTNASQSWNVGHVGLTSWDYYLRLDDTHIQSDSDDRFGSAPSATVVNIGDGSNVNYNNGNYMAYCWHPVEGFSKFGSYIANGSIDGSFVYLGFKPGLVIIKKVTTATQSWIMKDSTRNPHNPATRSLYANLSNAESPDTADNDNDIDLLSNGFKVKNSGHTGSNSSGETYIYCAWAESPFGGSDVAQARAR